MFELIPMEAERIAVVSSRAVCRVSRTIRSEPMSVGVFRCCIVEPLSLLGVSVGMGGSPSFLCASSGGVYSSPDEALQLTTT